MELMKALTNQQIVAVFTSFEAGTTKAQLSRDYNVNVKTITKAIGIAQELKEKALANKAEKISEDKEFKVEQKVIARPKKKIFVVNTKKSFKQEKELRLSKKKNTQKRFPINSAMKDALMNAGVL